LAHDQLACWAQHHQAAAQLGPRRARLPISWQSYKGGFHQPMYTRPFGLLRSARSSWVHLPPAFSGWSFRVPCLTHLVCYSNIVMFEPSLLGLGLISNHVLVFSCITSLVRYCNSLTFLL
jgi:hypothetical protein